MTTIEIQWRESRPSHRGFDRRPGQRLRRDFYLPRPGGVSILRVLHAGLVGPSWNPMPRVSDHGAEFNHENVFYRV